MQPIYFVWLFWILLSSCGQHSENLPHARQGVLDAEGLFARESVSLYLEGEWDFYPGQLLTPREVEQIPSSHVISVPGLWPTSGIDGEPVFYGTYRLRLVNHGLPPVFSIRNHQIYSAFRLYMNGEEVLANGTVAETKQKEVPYYHPKTISVHTHADTLDFVLQVSNHHYRRGGVAESVVVGKASCLLRDNLRSAGLDFFLTGGLLIMAIYYLSLFLVFKRYSPSLYFSIFIFLIILRILVTGQRLVLFILPGISWDSMLRIEYGTLYLAPLFFVLFFKTFFQKEIRVSLVNAVMTVSGIFTLLVLFTPVNFFVRTLPIYQGYLFVLSLLLFYWLWKARERERDGALVLLMGFVVIFFTLLHDMIYIDGALPGSGIFPAGLFIFILCQSYVMSLKFSQINKENQLLWDELDYKNKNLETIVDERTRELTNQKNLLQKTNHELEKSRESMMDQSKMLEDINDLLEKEKEKSDQLLLNVLPQNIANELKMFGKSLAHNFPSVSVLFVDFVGFSRVAENIDASVLLEELHFYFAGFDDIAKKYNLEKIKTIGDAYMCAGGLRENADERDVQNTVLAALEINSFVQAYREDKIVMKEPWFNCRIGIHTGPVIGGVVGKTKFSFDIWGPTVNVAKRMESACEPGKVNISEFTYRHLEKNFICKSRGLITVKHKQNMQMFYVEGLKNT